jgi:hypothetical protein
MIPSAFLHLTSPIFPRRQPQSASPSPQGKLSWDESKYDFGLIDDVTEEGEVIMRTVFKAEVKEGGGIPLGIY